MNAAQTSYVRRHQMWVLASLQLATKPVTPREIADLLNARQDETSLPPTDPVEVEASLAALMLRPRLRNYIACNTRRATVAESARRRRRGLGAFSTVVILSACSAVPPAISPVPNGSALHSYFGGVIPAPKEDASPSRPVFSRPTLAQAYAQAVEITAQEPDTFASKTPADRTGQTVASYFDDAGTFVRYAQRQEADLVPELKTAKAPDRDIQLVAIHVEPLPLISLSLAQNAPSPSATVFTPTVSPPSLDRLLPPSPTVVAAPATGDAEQKALSRKSARLDLGDTDRPDVYSELISFGNGSIVLSPAAVERVAALVEAAKHAEAIQLRGRVGNRLLDPAMARMAVGRAIAVRAALEAQGVPRSKIRIHMPRNADFVVAGDPAHESNRSVSVFMVVPEAQAASLGLHRGKPIRTASLWQTAP